MRIVTFTSDGERVAGAVRGDKVYDLGRARRANAQSMTVRSLLVRYGSDLSELERLLDDAIRDGLAPSGRIGEIDLAPPVTDPRKVLCVGLNYKDHVAETGRALPEHPDVFVKFAGTLIGPDEEIGGLEVTHDLDFEGELAIVIGRTAKSVSVEDALAHVAGAMVLNDITARDLQYRGTQWTMGKAVDGTTPCGPALVTLDEVGDVQALEISTRVNGKELQHSNTRHMIFPVAEIVAYISRTIALEPGDIIATGTPDGIGAKRTPPVWLAAGDEVIVEVEGVGILRNIVAAPPR